MFTIREVFPEDLEGLTAVAEHLNTVNLPNDRTVLEKLIEHSKKSFAGALDVFKREYLLVLVDDTTQKIIGTSMIHAQHGTRRAPHIFFDVMQDERYSETLDRHFIHKVLRIGYNYNGPTEIGGLVLHPSYRRNPVALGKWLSYVRFLYIGLHRASFRDEVLSELLPPLETDGTSLLWEALGRHFTGMSYQEADRVSQSNKEFIRALFPADSIYISLLPYSVQGLIGKVGPETKGVEKMLRRIGFEYADRIDPFDGGPHFIAKTDDITLVKASRAARVVALPDGTDDAVVPTGLVSVERDRAPHFAATGSTFRLEGGDVGLPAATMKQLGLQPGDSVGVLPF
ncbi:MAG: Arginine N-succinyltransferase [Myxococcales bacterium]|nr:Arginine N-succinyltransferase [Myxococcales bacterium]